MKTAYITHPLCLKHDMGGYHPESPARINAIEDQLIACGLFDSLLQCEAPAATREQLARVHSADHINFIFSASPQRDLVELDSDTAMNPYTLQAALRAAGAAVLGVDRVMAGDVANAFCNVRPPGHHAGRASAMGFCFFNNVAVGAAHALAQHGLERVAIMDFDVHHGNGTEHIFRDDARVMLCSTFQHPFYPYCGAASGNAHIINIPLAAHTGSAGFRAAVSDIWLPTLDVFRPELLMISAGFDAHREDEMAMLQLTDEDYVWVTQTLKNTADNLCGGRIVSVLEGGYALPALGRCAAAHVRVLCGS